MQRQCLEGMAANGNYIWNQIFGMKKDGLSNSGLIPELNGQTIKSTLQQQEGCRSICPDYYWNFG
jgi:hypothetical protein